MNLRNWLLSLWRICLCKKGQIPLDGNDRPLDEDTTSTPTTDPEPTPEPGQETGDEQQGVIPAAAEQAQQEETFLQGANLDPRKLPPEIQPIFKKMQGAYTKRMQEIAKVRDQAGIVDKFYNDRDFAFQTVAQWAAQNGFSITPVGAQNAQPAQQQSGKPQPQVSQQLIESIKANLPQELQWMAESTGPAISMAVEQLLKPVIDQLRDQQTSGQKQTFDREYDASAQELSAIAPGWEEHEDAMTEALEFLQGKSFKHPKFGSKHQLLFNLVTGNAAATAEITKRMNQAAKNRPSSGISTGPTSSNLAERIRTAKNSNEAFRLAAQAAESGTGR